MKDLQSFRKNAIRQIVGSAISHEVRSPTFHFQNSVDSYLSKYKKTKYASQDIFNEIENNLEKFASITNSTNDKLRDTSEKIRPLRKLGIEISFENIYSILKSETRPLIIELQNEMDKLIGKLIKNKVITSNSKETSNLNRYKITLERLYFALETITDPHQPVTEETVNLISSLKNLYESAVPNENNFTFAKLAKSLKFGDILTNNALKYSIIENKKNPTIYGTNRKKIISILQNILLNALRYADQSSEKVVFYYWEEDSFANLIKNTPYDEKYYEQKGKWILFHILNSGRRINENFEANLFDLGQTRGDRHDRYGGGSGMGLAIVKLMVCDLGGLVFYNSAEKRLTDFCVLLPINSSDRINSELLFANEYGKLKS